jgi:hypothetical protein
MALEESFDHASGAPESFINLEGRWRTNARREVLVV